MSTRAMSVRAGAGRPNWRLIAFLVAMHLGALLAPWTFSWSALWVFLLLHLVTGGLGVSLGYHRLLAHRSLRVPAWLESVLVTCGTLSQGRPISWVAQHRLHHAEADRAGDLHSPTRGFWWAHMGWFLVDDERIHDPALLRRFAPDLLERRFYRWLERYWALPTLLLVGGLAVLGGLSWVVWGFCLRMVVVFHSTSAVNSAATIWGYKSYDTNEGSRNNWLVALLTYGEGWHNNHHAYPYSAAHGLRWWEADATYLMIRLLGALGLASEIRLPQGPPLRLPDPQPTSGACEREPVLQAAG